MIAYIDSSVFLRIVFGSPESLPEWFEIQHYVSSAPLRVECARAVERLRLTNKMSADEATKSRAAIAEMMKKVELIGIISPVLDRASEPYPFVVKTLDAIHLATAMLWREEKNTAIIFATHDGQLASAAQSVGFTVLGTPPSSA